MTQNFKQTLAGSGRVNPINFGLVCVVLTAVALKFHLVFVLKIGWDEFLYLANVHSYLRQELTAPLQTFHVHLFAWLPAVSTNEVTQVIAARIILFILFTGSCFLVYLIGKQVLNKSGALFSVLCYVSLSNIIFHGASFRADSICSFLFLFSIYLIVARQSSWISFILSGVSMALSLMVSIKVSFHLFTVGCVFICLFLFSENRKQTVFQFIVFAVTFAATLVLLYYFHRLSILGAVPSGVSATGTPKTGVVEFAGRAGSKVIMSPMLGYTFLSIYENIVIWFWLFLGAAVIFWDGVRYQKWLGSARFACLSFCFLIPVLTLLFYRNTFPYYFVFIMGPAIIFCGVIIHKFAPNFQKTRASRWLIFAAALAVPVFTNFMFHYSTAKPDQLTAQKELISTVHEIFPEPVPYIDARSVIASFPKVGFFMSTWGMENYIQAGEPVMRHLIETRQPSFLLASLPSLDISLPRENPFTKENYSLFEKDWQVLKSNFIPHWGLVYVAGKQFKLTEQVWFNDFEILIPGFYTLEAKKPIEINGTVYQPGSVLFLDLGHHTISLLNPEVLYVTLRLGKNLYRPKNEPEIIPDFYKWR